MTPSGNETNSSPDATLAETRTIEDRVSRLETSLGERIDSVEEALEKKPQATARISATVSVVALFLTILSGLYSIGRNAEEDSSRARTELRGLVQRLLKLPTEIPSTLDGTLDLAAKGATTAEIQILADHADEISSGDVADEVTASEHFVIGDALGMSGELERALIHFQLAADKEMHPIRTAWIMRSMARVHTLLRDEVAMRDAFSGALALISPDLDGRMLALDLRGNWAYGEARLRHCSEAQNQLRLATSIDAEFSPTDSNPMLDNLRVDLKEVEEAVRNCESINRP